MRIDPSKPNVPRHAGGFTLVELLVVIGIIAVLISVMLPILGKARESGKRVICLSNLRQQYLANAYYANDNKGAMPLGFNYRKGFGHMLWDAGYPIGTYPRYIEQGVLIQAGYVKAKYFFCPSEVDPQYMFDTPVNPWTPIPSQWAIFSGYTSRPLADWSDNSAINKNVPLLYYAGHYPWVVGPKYMRLNWFPSTMAILSDNFPYLGATRTRHKNGLNVMFADGSGIWIPESLYKDSLSVVNDQFNPVFNNIFLNNDGESNRSGIWVDFDRTR